jgi:RNA polymerase sigma-70 factor, ECF subfamily
VFDAKRWTSLKLPRGDTHSHGVAGDMGSAAIPSKIKGEPPRLTLVADAGGRVGGLDDQFHEIYERWFDDIVRWLYALGMPSSETEDLAQDIFLVVRRKLARFDGGNLPGWLYRITELTVRDHRRRSWFKNMVVRRRHLDLSALPDGAESPARAYEQAENRRLFQATIAKMSEKRRSTFVLFEIEGYSGEEIAQIQDIPLSTVWTRLHHARKDFWKLVRGLGHREGKNNASLT